MTSQHDGRPAGMTLNSFTSVSLDPLLVLICLGEGTRTLAVVLGSSRFALSFLDRTQEHVALAFAKDGGPFPRHHTAIDEDGYILVNDALSVLRCRAHDLIPAGDHRLVVADVLSFESRAGDPLVFHRGAFGTVERSDRSGTESG